MEINNIYRKLQTIFKMFLKTLFIDLFFSFSLIIFYYYINTFYRLKEKTINTLFLLDSLKTNFDKKNSKYSKNIVCVYLHTFSL